MKRYILGIALSIGSVEYSSAQPKDIRDYSLDKAIVLLYTHLKPVERELLSSEFLVVYRGLTKEEPHYQYESTVVYKVLEDLRSFTKLHALLN